ncbi:MAG: hypothetical protein ABEJ72_00785 [Candidatus Aenigmatarchaeota archaeon]
MPSLSFEESSDHSPHLHKKGIPNPQEAYNEVVNILTMRCGFDKSDVDEKKYKHSREGDMETVHSEISATKSLDKYSKVVIDVEMDIKMKPVQGEEFDYVGDLEVDINGKVKTEYPQDSMFQRSILWHAMRVFYEKFLYNDVKNVYKDKVNSYVRTLRDDLKSYFDMLS